MDFKKAYEAALERAKNIYNENPSSSTAKFVCGQIFPELKESEDERIRKELIDFVNHYRNNTDLTTEQAEWTKKAIVYLEKQNAEFIEYGRQEYFRGRTEAIDEQKPAEFKYRDDEKLFQLIEDVIRVYGKTQGEWIAGVDMDTLVVFLRRLRDKQPAGWSEEDEVKLNDVIRMIEDSGHVKSIIKHYTDFLKSLRPAWKPSEEHIRVLLKANPVNLMPDELSVYKSICSEIQKLM